MIPTKDQYLDQVLELRKAGKDLMESFARLAQNLDSPEEKHKIHKYYWETKSYVLDLEELVRQIVPDPRLLLFDSIWSRNEKKLGVRIFPEKIN